VIPWIVEPATAKAGPAQAGETEGIRVEIRMLTRQNQARQDTARCKRMRDGGKLDDFGTGADDQPYVGKTQSSP